MSQESKSALRKEMLAHRDYLTEAEVRKKSKLIVEKILNHREFKFAQTIAIYLAKGNEVSLEPLISKAISLGKELCVPVLKPVQDKRHEMVFYKLFSLDDLEKGKFGIHEPKTKISPSRKPEVILVPGVVFDLHCHRLGYGKGYYDKHLANFAGFSIGVCYDFQLKEKLPNESHDVPLSAVITEKRIITRTKSSL